MRPIFIVGMARSGTSLLISLLDGHPGLICLPGETQLLEKRHRVVTLDTAMRMGAVRNLYDGGESVSGIDADAVARALCERFRPGGSAGDLLEAIAHAVAELRAAEPDRLVYWVEKTPNHYRLVPLLEHWFGEQARYLFLIRDPIDVYHSQLGLQRPPGFWSFVRNVHLYAAATMRFSSGLAGRARVVRYERLAATPEAEMREITEFLGLDFADCLLMPSRNGAPLGDNVDGKRVWWRSAVTGASIGKGRSELPRAEQCRLSDAIRGPMRALGYEPVAGDGLHAAPRLYGALLWSLRGAAPRFLSRYAEDDWRIELAA